MAPQGPYRLAVDVGQLDDAQRRYRAIAADLDRLTHLIDHAAGQAGNAFGGPLVHNAEAMRARHDRAAAAMAEGVHELAADLDRLVTATERIASTYREPEERTRAAKVAILKSQG